MFQLLLQKLKPFVAGSITFFAVSWAIATGYVYFRLDCTALSGMQLQGCSDQVLLSNEFEWFLQVGTLLSLATAGLVTAALATHLPVVSASVFGVFILMLSITDVLTRNRAAMLIQEAILITVAPVLGALLLIWYQKHFDRTISDKYPVRT